MEMAYIVSPRRCESFAIIVPPFHSQNKIQKALGILSQKPRAFSLCL